MRAIPAFLLLILLVKTGEAAIVDGGVFLGAGGGFGGDYALGVYQEPSKNDYTAVFVDFSYSASTRITLTGVNTLIDEGSDWFFVRAGDVFDATTIQRGDYDLIVGDESGRFQRNSVRFSPEVDAELGLEESPDDFYLGVATGDIPPSSTLGYSRTIFGWAKFRLVVPNSFPPAARIELLDSAVSFGQGIIVGTRTVVPEPSGNAIGLTMLLASLSSPAVRRGCVDRQTCPVASSL